VGLQVHDDMRYVHVLTVDHIQPTLDEITHLADHILAVFTEVKGANSNS
jgi:hypothetical protein